MDVESQINSLCEAVVTLQKSVSCSICLEIMVNPSRTKCGHSFCHDCIMTVVNKNRMANCPLCNSKINRRTVKENEKAKILVERVTDVVNSIGKDLGMDIVAHARVPKSTHEALLKSPQVQRVLRQSKLQPKTAWQKSDLKCKSKSEKQENKEKNLELIPKSHLSPISPNEKEDSKEKEEVKTPEHISISQVLPLSPPATDEKVPYNIPKNVEEVPRKKKVEEWLDKEFDAVTSIETEDKKKPGQVTVIADVHKTEAEDVKPAPKQRVRCYRISKKKAMVFTDADKITVDSGPEEENNKKRKVENNDKNEEQNTETVGNTEDDPYMFISSQKTPAKPKRKSSRQKDKENKSASTSNNEEMQKKKPKIMSAKPLPVRYNESQTLSVDIYDTFDKLVVTANKIEPPASKEEHSDSDDTVFLFRTPLEGNSRASEDPCDLNVHLGLGDAVSRKLEGNEAQEKMPNKRSSKAGGQRRTRSKSAGTSKSSVKPDTGSHNIKQMLEESKANATTPLSPSRKINQAVDGVSLADAAVKNIPAIKSLILDEAMKQEMQVLEKENLSDVIESATPINVSKLNSTIGTKSPGWSRISKSKKEFDKLKKRECAALNVSGGMATKRNKITDSFKKVSSDTLHEPVLPLAEDTQNAVDIPISTVKPIADDSPKLENLNPIEITEERVLEKMSGEDNSPKPEVSLILHKSHIDSFSDMDVLDSPASRKRKIDIKNLIAFLNNEKEASKVAETTNPKDVELSVHGPHEEELKKQSEPLEYEKAEPQQEVGDQEPSSETKLSHKNKDEVEKASEDVKVNHLSHITMEKQKENDEVQTNKVLDSCIILKDSEEFMEKNKKNVMFVKRGRFTRPKHIPFIFFGKLASRKRTYSEVIEEDVVKCDELQHNSQGNVVMPPKPDKSLISACIQTSPTLVLPSPEKRTLEFVGAEESQGCNFVAGSSDTIDLPSVIPLPHNSSAAILRGQVAFFSPSQTDDIPTQKFNPPPPAKKPNTADKTHNKEQKSGTNSGSKMTLSQFSNATTVKYNRFGRDSPENSLEMCNYSPDLSVSLLEVENHDSFEDNDDAPAVKLSNEVSSGNDSDIRVPFKSKTVNRRLNFVPELTDPALDADTELHPEETKKPFKRIRSPSSSDSDSETLVPEISDSHSSGSKRMKHNEEEDIEIVNLISSQENNGKAESETDVPNSAEVNARIMANIAADLAVKRSHTSNDCDESVMEEERDTPVMFTPTEYFGSQIGNSCSTDFQPNSAASSEAIILGTLQAENEFKIKPKTPTGEKSELKVNASPQGVAALNKTSDGDCDSDDGFVQPTPSKDDSANPRNAKTSWGSSELRSVSIGALRDVVKEPESLPKHSETTVGKPSPHDSEKSFSLMNRLSTQRVASSVDLEKPNNLKQLEESTPKITTETDLVQKSRFGGKPAGDSQSASVRTVSKTPETSKKTPTPVKPCFVCSGLPPSMIAQVKALASMVNAEFSNTFTPNTTHLILKDAEDNLAYKTLKYLYAVVYKTWVVSFSWVSNCLRERKLLPEDDYEMLDSSGENGPYRARNSKDLLLGNFEFCCVEPYTDITKDQLEELLKKSGASVVNSPEEIKFRSGVHNMILVQMEAKTEEEVQSWWDKYGVITAAHEWVLDSIGRYRVIPIWPYLMTDIEEEHLQALGYPDELLATDELEPESQTLTVS